MQFTTVEELRKLKAKEVDAVLEEYVAAGVEMVDGLTNKNEKLAFIELLLKDKGYPKKVTAEDLEMNPALAIDGVEVGSYVFLPFPFATELNDAPEGSENAGTSGNDTEGENDEENAAEGNSAPTSATPDSDVLPEPEVTPVSTGDLVTDLLRAGKIKYEGQVIHNVRPRIQNGRTVVELDCSASIFTVTGEEWEAILARAQVS